MNKSHYCGNSPEPKPRPFLFLAFSFNLWMLSENGKVEQVRIYACCDVSLSLGVQFRSWLANKRCSGFFLYLNSGKTFCS